MLDLELRPRLSRFLHLRPEADKVVFAYVPHLSLRTAAIHPTVAIALSLIDGERTWGQIAEAFAILSQQPTESALRGLMSIAQHVDPRREIIMEDGILPGRRFDPERFLIPEQHVNLSTRFEAPVAINFKVTTRCKTNCLYCYAPRQDASKKRELPTERVKEILREAHELGVFQVNLCGGDGFARADFVDIIEESLRLSLVTDISTKVPISEAQALSLADIGLDYLQVSIDCSIPNISDTLVGKRGHFNQLVQGIKRLKRAGIYVRTNSVVTKLNAAVVPETIRFLADLGINEMKVTPAFESFHADTNDHMLSEDDAARLESTVAALQAEWRNKGVQIYYSRLKPARSMTQVEKKKFWFRDRGVCSGGRSAIFVTPEGKVTLCEQVPHEAPFIVGDLTRQSILEVWNSLETSNIAHPARERFAGTICYDCDDFPLCAESRGHCFRDSWFENATLCGPSPYCPHNATANQMPAQE